MMSWNYIAGFFDGEGSVTHNGKGFRIHIPQTHLRVLQKIQDFIGTGHIAVVTKRKAHWKDNWLFYIAKQKDVKLFLQQVKPFVHVKKEHVFKALKAIQPLVDRQDARLKLAEYRKKRALELRNKDYSYRKIGKVLGIDWGYARRLTLNKN
ncbi:MAG: LAGLIDADG family homing endonuclease [Patescibacteria group bacterium]